MDLQECVKRDGATLIEANKSVCHFICKCGTRHHKAPKAICITSGAFCKSCTSRNTSIKRIKKMIEINEMLLLNAQAFQS